MTRKLLCKDGNQCPIDHSLEITAWEIKDVAGIQIETPILNCETAGGPCNGTTIIDHGDCMENCPVCRGLGVIRVEREITHPQFGKMAVCPNKPVRKVEDISGTGLHRDDMKYTWDSWKQTGQFKRMRRAFSDLRATQGGWLYLFGPHGTGKTVAARAAITDIIRQGRAANTYYTTHSILIKWLNAAYSEEGGQQVHLERLQQIQNISFLVIDEIGQGSSSEAGTKTMNDILTVRDVQAIRGGSKTVLISNYGPEEAGFDPHIVDRIRSAQYEVVNIVGMSMRQLAPEAGV